jgi:hypothetical protein
VYNARSVAAKEAMAASEHGVGLGHPGLGVARTTIDIWDEVTTCGFRAEEKAAEAELEIVGDIVLQPAAERPDGDVPAESPAWAAGRHQSIPHSRRARLCHSFSIIGE